MCLFVQVGKMYQPRENGLRFLTRTVDLFVGWSRGKRTRYEMNEAMKILGKKNICTTRWRHNDGCQSGRVVDSLFASRRTLWYGTTTNDHNGQSKRVQATTKNNPTEVRLETRTRTGHLELLQRQSLASWKAFTTTGDKSFTRFLAKTRGFSPEISHPL